MKSSTPSAWRMQAVMIVLPVLALAALGVLGLVEMRRGVLELMRDSARRVCEAEYDTMRQQMEALLVQNPAPALFGDPPRPGGAETTESGLPRKVIEAFEKWKKQPESISVAEMQRLVLETHPNVISPEIMSAVDPDDKTRWRSKWRQIEQKQAFLRSGAFPAEGVKQLETREDASGQLWLLGPPRGLISLEALAQEKGIRSSGGELEWTKRALQDFCDVYFFIGRGEGSPQLHGEVLASQGTLPRVSAVARAADMEGLFAVQRRLTLGFAAVLVVSVLSAVWGLLSLRRVVLQQQALSDLKTNFIASVTHELRAPVASMQLLAEGLQNGTVSTETKRQDYFRLLVEECRRLGGLIANVLDISRIERGARRFEFEEADLRALVLDTVRLHQPRAESLGLTLRVEAAEIAAQADSTAIQQALTNLLDNALKFAPRPSEIVVTLQGIESTHWRLTVLDHGPGVPPESRERIFDPFFRLGSELRRETQGVGIGLSIVKHIAEAHHGRVWVECDSATSFHLECPVQNQQSGI
ncbi:MAG: HAMP domain-containing histidine kinase [Verrucomicrobiaceae bacterium]|nr:HAMP domain-containing histidine kinase [Verrucomicrobiaceae bacterium]